MNPFRHVIINEGFTPERTGDPGWAFVVLGLLADLFDAGAIVATHDDPYAEVFHALRNYHETAGVKWLRVQLNSKVPTNVA